MELDNQSLVSEKHREKWATKQNYEAWVAHYGENVAYAHFIGRMHHAQDLVRAILTDPSFSHLPHAALENAYADIAAARRVLHPSNAQDNLTLIENCFSSENIVEIGTVATQSIINVA